MRNVKGRNFRQAPSKDKYRINERITGNEVRVIDEDGQMVGVMSARDALEMAQGRSLDLIEIAPNANPPTCKIMDYGKWKYESKKKAQIAKKKQTVISIKEIQLRPRTDEHDLNVKLNHARRFLLDGDKVKVNLRFQGREMAHQDMGITLIKKITDRLNDLATVEVEPKMEGRQLFAILAPDSVKIKEFQANKKKMDELAAKEAVNPPPVDAE